VIDVQRGVVTASNATLGHGEIHRRDQQHLHDRPGHKVAKVAKVKATAMASQITTNDQVRVVATTTGNNATVQHIGDAGPAK